MPLIKIREPKWADAGHSAVDVVGDIVEPTGTIAEAAPYTSIKGDQYFDEIVGGRYGPIAEFVPQKVDHTVPIGVSAAMLISAAYGNNRSSVNNYFAQLAALKALGKITTEQQSDLDALLKAADWEQKVLDQRDELLKNPTKEANAKAADPKSWPAFPAEAAKVVATC